ncbi:UNVERIFIED_CONTAM: hypothetical protein GTU68_012629 [Idotea baltica]|nr:hypothetical protein [Idotea baltica]
MAYGQEILIFGQDWARIHFVENEGMAFGWKWGGSTGKLILSLFRIIAVGFLIKILMDMIKRKDPKGLIVCFGLILAGAIGNIVDSAFYGWCFSESTSGEVAHWFPESGPKRGFLFGKVVDMFYFPMWNGTWPEWLPMIGGNRFQFFRPVFNFADSAITTGVACILLFYRSFFFTAPERAGAESSNPTTATVITKP